MENQEIEKDYNKLNLQNVLEECIISFEELIEEKALNLSIDIQEVIMISNKTYLELVFNNLISNAIKFTDNGGTITISCSPTIDGAKVTIEDTGCGISVEDGKRIFDKFYQGDTSHSGEGNGLGLPLVKKVIDVLGGKISVSSILGKGTTFTLYIKDKNEQ